MKKLFIAAALLLVPTSLFLACGGGGDGATGPVTVPLTGFQNASVVIGQPTFTTGLMNRGGSAGANTLNQPFGNPVVLSGKLYLPDWANRRVLGFNTVPTANDASADFVLGQPNMTTVISALTATGMAGPQTVKAYNGKLFVDEWDGNRVIIFNTAPTGTGAAANVVVGQSGFGSIVTACSQTVLSHPENIEVVGGKLMVADSDNNRVLIWNSIPTSNGQPADVVLGQGDFTHCVANDNLQTGASGTASARTLNYPTGLWSDGTKLIVSDTYNNRVLIWNTIPTTNFVSADKVLGQSDFTHKAFNDDLQTGATSTIPSARTLSYPYFIDSNGTQLFVADEHNNRVLVWNSIPLTNFAPADKVLGQADFTHGVANDDLQTGMTSTVPSARTLNNPAGVYIYGTKLFVTDRGNHRYLIFN